tara:strand:+ start:2207 stop:3598 length:1392 start_codon:yes stop_codon:yes gene_type:complete
MKDDKFFISESIKYLKQTVILGQTSSIDWRIKCINIIENLIENHKQEIINALYSDLGKSKIEAFSEILLVKQEIALVKNKLRSWMRPKNIIPPFYYFPSSTKVLFEPLGCVLVLGPYNYPFLYIFKPLVNIFSAGNTALIKPSEKCPTTSKLIKKLCDKYFPNNILLTLEGGYKKAAALVKEDFDHIFFTGSSKTGKSIMKSASNHLTPLTLELSGTNPVVILKNADLKIAARRIVWGKFFNTGQSCMAPNHLFVEKSILEELIIEIQNSILEFYGNNPINSDNLSKLEEKQYSRTLQILKNSIKNKKLIYGGKYSKKKSKISPTLLKVKNEKDPLINNEIFGSLLPIMAIDNHKVAIEIIQNSSKPLAIYIFGGDKSIHKKITKLTSSGTICINDVMLPVLIPNLPFGGVGLSGMGKFHGEEGFKTFSNQKTITKKSSLLDIKLRYPPYDNLSKLINMVFKI